MQTNIAAAAQQVPGYCTSGHGILTPAQWSTCAKLGWSQPVNSTVGHVGYTLGSNAVPAIGIILIILALVWLVRRSGSGATATR